MGTRMSFNGRPTKGAKTPANTAHRWMETEATVTGCRYEFARMNTLTFGIAANNNQFLVAFNYYAHGKSYNDEFASRAAMDKGETFRLFYNPMEPRENSTSAGASSRRSPLFALGVAGSVVLTLLYLGMIYGCS